METCIHTGPVGDYVYGQRFLLGRTCLLFDDLVAAVLAKTFSIMESKPKDENMVGVQSDVSQEKQMGIEPVLSVGEGDMEAPTEKHGHLHRTLSPRLIHVCSDEGSCGIFT